MIAVLAEAFVGSEASKFVIVGATVLAVGGIVTSFAVVFGKRQATLERRLAGYEPASVTMTAGGGQTQAMIAPPETGVVQQGVDIASRIADRTGVLGRVELALEQADLPMRAGELVFYVPVFATFAFLFLSILFGWIIGVIAAFVTVTIPIVMVQRRRRARLSKFEALLPPTLTLLASSMRAGFSLMQGLETVSQETPEPMRRELQRVFTEVRLGRSIEDALGEVADRMGSRDLAWTVMAIRIQREVGGNLASLLDTVADTMTQRERLRREVHSLTAEGRLSAVVLSLFAPAMALIILVVRPDYLDALFDYAIGWIAIIFAVIANIVGWFWLRRIVDIEA